MIHGRFLAEITKEVIGRLEASKFERVEWRISIHGSFNVIKTFIIGHDLQEKTRTNGRF